MTPDPIYHLTGPTAFYGPPAAFSYSSLGSIERCPRQWQLAHSRYGDRDGFPARPSPAAAEGEIVHKGLDHLFRRLSFFGLPAAGSAGFRAAVVEADVAGLVAGLVGEHESRLRRHPRGAGARLSSTAEQLLNRVIRLFREAYEGAVAVRPPFADRAPVARSVGTLPSGPALADLVARRGALGELPLTHPGLPFRGVLDLVWWDGGAAVVTDFKTGSPRAEHQVQVGYYAVLWWRSAGVRPARTEVRYPGSAVSESMTDGRLAQLEADLAARIEAARAALATAPAPANVGEACRFCDVRQFCDRYWENPEVAAGPGDVELTIAGEPTVSGFAGTTQAGEPVSVVFHPDVGRAHGVFHPGERVRILNAVASERGRVLELRAWSEVFRLGRRDA